MLNPDQIQINIIVIAIISFSFLHIHNSRTTVKNVMLIVRLGNKKWLHCRNLYYDQ